jgi:diguanylate cyclase (GGDEF)-like protein
MAKAFAALYGAGGVVVLLTLLLAHPQGRMIAWMVAPAAAAIMLGLALLVRGAELPIQAFYLLPPLGSVLIAMVVYGAGRQLRSPYASLFFWAISSAFYFFPRRIAAPNVAVIAVLYLVVLWRGHESFLVVRYAVPIAALVATAVLIDRLNAERGHLEREVEHMVNDLHELSRTDPLTGLANRRELEDQLEREFARARRSPAPVSLLMIDLDRFKLYNDTHGHPAGDRMLCEVAALWQQRLRSSDVLARYGGEEFVVLLADCALDDALELAERLRELVPYRQTCSFGAATWDGRESGDDLIERADKALLAAKRAGGDRVCVAPVSSAAI